MGPVAKYEALASWRLSKHLEKKLGDVSDLAVSEDHTLYLLSDQSQSVARMDDLPAPGESRATAAEVHRIRGNAKKSEGLAVLENGQFLVALDRRKPRGNLLLLGRD